MADSPHRTGAAGSRPQPRSVARRCGPAAVLALGLTAAGCFTARRPLVPAARSAAAAATAAADDASAPTTPVQPLLDPPITTSAVEEPDTPEGVFHRVEQGQTLWRIARAYGVDLQELAEVNGVKDPRDLEAGRMLYVPGALTPLEVAPYPAPPPSTLADDAARARAAIVTTEAGFAWPVAGGGILSTFGVPRRNHLHAGIDIAGSPGQDVVAAAAGEVVFSGSSPGGYGKLVIVDHGGGLETLYAHNSKLLVQVGDTVGRGQVLALVGRTGNATTEHCHFEVRREKVAVDPVRFFAPDSVAALRNGAGAAVTGVAGSVAGKASPR